MNAYFHKFWMRTIMVIIWGPYLTMSVICIAHTIDHNIFLFKTPREDSLKAGSPLLFFCNNHTWSGRRRRRRTHRRPPPLLSHTWCSGFFSSLPPRKCRMVESVDRDRKTFASPTTGLFSCWLWPGANKIQLNCTDGRWRAKTEDIESVKTSAWQTSPKHLRFVFEDLR